ncbi:MAG: peptidoglycan DD-metalloendopeptidase family protein [Acidobacteriota bacterium]
MPPLNFAITGSVGRSSNGAMNQQADVETVQNMLRQVAMILNEPRFDPGAISGTIQSDESTSPTIQAIEAFQSRFLTTPDGVIGVGRRTWNELMAVLEGEPAEGGSPGDGQFFFPFTRLPDLNWTESIRRFGARRSGGARAHAACDLYFPVGTTIHAITSGSVVRGPYPFYAGTFALEIDHGSFLARYGEIQQSAFVSNGDHVSAGQPIARVGRLVGFTNSMLHFELYDKSAHGPLTVTAAQSSRAANGLPFMRRRDLLDPTTKLNEWRNNLAPA